MLWQRLYWVTKTENNVRRKSLFQQHLPIVHSGNSIHRMQIWRTTRSSPGTSYMKARLVSLQCFVLKVLPQKALALTSLCSVLFRCAYEFLCFWMRREGIEIFHLSPLRENSGSMQFVETEKRSSRSPRELKFACYVSGEKISEKSFKWRAYVESGGVPTWFSWPKPSQGKEKLFLNDILSLKGRSYFHSRPLARNRTKQILRCNQANELQLPRRWNQWKH